MPAPWSDEWIDAIWHQHALRLMPQPIAVMRRFARAVAAKAMEEAEMAAWNWMMKRHATDSPGIPYGTLEQADLRAAIRARARQIKEGDGGR